MSPEEHSHLNRRTFCRTLALPFGAVGRLLRVAIVILVGLMPRASAQVTYPYILPNNMSASLNINLGSKTNFNNRLLMLNCDWNGSGYSRGYYDPDAIKLINTFQPPGLRWPAGVWSDFYDYTTDNVAVYDGYTNTYYNIITNWASNSNMVFGFPSLATLHSNLQFDVLSTWNINYDGTNKSVARLQYQEANGVDTKWIELGNESFWVDQRSLAISNVQAYISVTRAHATALRAVKPAIKLSVPVQWYPDVAGSWNSALATNTNYFDAVSVHVYIEPSTNAEAAVLGARNGLLAAVQPVAQMFPNKPIWLSEWSSGCGANAITVLGITDEYLGIFDHPELFEQASFFQMNGKHFPPLYVWNTSSNKTTKTSAGAAYEIIRNIFKDSQLFASSIVSSTITNDQNAVNAEAVVKNGGVTIFAINKTTNSVPLNLTFGGRAYTNGFNHQAFVFTNLNDYFTNYSLTANVMVPIGPGTNGGILLPPMSLNQISGLTLPAAWTLMVNAGTNQTITSSNDTALVSLDGTASSSATGTITNFTWMENGTTIATGSSPTVALSLGTHTITLTVADTTGATRSDTVVVTVVPKPLTGALYSDLADSGPRQIDGSSPSILGITASDPTLYAGRSGTGGTVDRCIVFPFQLPSLGAVTNPFVSVSFSFSLVSNDFAPTNCNLDLYGLPQRALPTVLASDFYSETNAPDPTPGVQRLQDNICTPGSAVGIYTSSAAGSSNLLSFLNAQYSGGTNAGKFVFLRLNKDAAVGVSTKKFTVTAANGALTNNAGLPDYTIWPKINYTVVPPGGTNLQLGFKSVVRSSGSGVTLSWDGVGGLNYTVYQSGTLTDGWTPASGVLIGTNGILSFDTFITSTNRQFFKIVVP